MKKHGFVAVFLPSFLVFFFISISSQAQTVTQQKGLTTVEFSSPQGIISVYLPSDIRPGDHISGSITVQPVGKNEKQKQKALAELLKGKLRIGNPNDPQQVAQSLLQRYPNIPERLQPIIVSQPFSVSLIDGKNLTSNVEIHLPAIVNQTTNSGCFAPTHALVGEPLRITGNFDGDASNTKCSLGNKELPVLAESTSQCFLLFPQDAAGLHTLTVKENDKQKCTQQVSGVDMQVSAGKLNLLKGQTTYIDVTISNLQNLPDTAFLTINNITRDVVVLPGGNDQLIPILPASDSGTGKFYRRFVVHSIKTGDFTVNVNLDLPEQAETNGHPPTTTEPQQCKCHADCSIEKAETRKGEISYAAKVKAECIGNNCSVAKITYRWSIGKSGEDVAEIDGLSYTPGVTVKIKKPGPFNVYLNGTVTCSNGSTCDFGCSWEEAGPPDHPPTITECGLSYKWCPGPAIKLLSSGYYPSSDEILKQFRPGDLIGLSVLANDLDILVQHCLCPEGLEVKQHPPTPDQLVYNWELKNFENGKGSLVMHSGSESNSVLYQLPFCIQDFPIRDKITVTIKNKGAKADDDSIKVLFTIRVFIPPSKYKEQYVVTRSLDIKITKEILSSPADVVCEKETEGDCVVLPPLWEEGSKLSRTATIEIRRPADRPPDYIMVLHADASDNDDLELKCFHKKTGKTIVEKLTGVYDDCDFTWTVIGGTGSFPLGNKGSSVVFKHDYGVGNKVTIQCTISDSKLQFPDKDPEPLTTDVEPRIKPMALVGVGDISYLGMKDAHGELFEAAKIAMKNYEKAGYKVDFQAEVTSGKIEPTFTNNAYQAVMLIGHGNELGFSGADGVSFIPGDIGPWVYSKWRCTTTLSNNKQPLIRELIMLGCNMGKANWYRSFFSLENYYVRYEWVWSSAFFSSVKKYVEKEHKPLPPRIVDP